MSYVLAMDQGTTSSRAIVFDGRGRTVVLAQKEFHQSYPRPGWVEHDPEEIWQSQLAVAREAVGKAGLGPGDFVAVGIANQRETTVVWDRGTGEPIYPAIVWQDRRTAERCDELRADGVERTIRAKTGLLLDAYFSGTKIGWVLDHVEGARARAESGELAFGTIDSWLAYKLTGGKRHITDASNASRTLLYDLHEGRWDSELLDIFGVPGAMLPEVRATSEVYDSITGISELEGVPLASLVGDQQAALMGQVCVSPGMAKNTYGTGCFLLMNTGEEPRSSKNDLLTTMAWDRDGRRSFSLEGGVFVGGAIVQWLRDGLKIIQNASDVEALARTVPDNGGLVMVPALSGLGAPHWDPYARGTILGVTRGTTAGHLARAALEGIAFEVADLVEAFEVDAGRPMTELRVDGGASNNDLLMQFQADVLGFPVVRPKVLETTALGAAYLAGLAVGSWTSVSEIAEHQEIDRRFEPQVDEVLARDLRSRWREGVERSKGWARPEGGAE